MNDLPINVTKAIKARSEAILNDILFMVERGEIKDLDGCHAVIDDTHLDDVAAIYLDLDERLSLVELHAEDYGLELDGVSVGDIRRTIEEFAAVLICFLAESEARNAIYELETFLDENEFEFEDIASDNVYGWARHYSEREEDRCQVYEYRNVEGVHVDVWEYELSPGFKVYLTRVLEPEEVTAAELVFEAA